jgi:hypothetical protein
VERPRYANRRSPPGKPMGGGTMAGCHEMPREQQEAA